MKKADTRTAVCQICQNPFEVNARYSKSPDSTGADCTQLQKRTCPSCKAKQRREANARVEQKRKLESGYQSGQNLSGVSLCALSDTADMLKISKKNALNIERQALAKIRNDPELRQLFQDWMAEGGRIPNRQPEVQKQEAVGALVDFMMGVARWYNSYAHLLQGGHEKEALECMSEIRTFYKSLREQLKKYGITLHTGDYHG